VGGRGCDRADERLRLGVREESLELLDGLPLVDDSDESVALPNRW
jgi:hypothetical protein